MAIFQVNQSDSFATEYAGSYLCCPVGPYGGWPTMTRLKIGDQIVHYDGSKNNKIIRGISIVIPIKTVGLNNPQIVSPACAKISPPHLSLQAFSVTKSADVSRYQYFYVVYVKHQVAMDDPNLKKLPHVTYGGYLCRYPYSLSSIGV